MFQMAERVATNLEASGSSPRSGSIMRLRFNKSKRLITINTHDIWNGHMHIPL